MKTFDIFIRKINIKIFLISSILFVSFIIIVLPMVSVYTSEVTNNSDSPDTKLFYQGKELYEMAGDYGEEGRNMYVFLRVTFDIVWPLVYSIFILFGMAYFIKISCKYELRKLMWFPVLAIGFDYLENISTSLVMINYPTHLYAFEFIAPYFTFSKWLTLAIAFVGLAITLFFVIQKKYEEAISEK